MVKATYRPVLEDGADYFCPECGGRDSANLFWFAVTPDGKTHVNHKECFDQDWIKEATFIPRPLEHYSQIYEQE